MQGVGPGTILGGRYSLHRRLTQGRDLERWSAQDTTLEREVALTIVDSDHPHRAGILDAARRAAGVQDSRLVRILDVGTQSGHSYIVEESLSGAESLAAMLAQGTLPAEEARRIVGETAGALEAARQRGLHHLRLTPLCVLRTPGGEIKVSGVAVAAAIDGTEEPDPATASRRDAVAVVAVTYAALTSRWPLNEQVAGVEPAPRVVGGVPAPSEIAAGVPGDLDALCRMTLNENTGPLTPGDFANQIAPWSRGVVTRSGVEPTAVLELSSSIGASAEPPTAGRSAPVGEATAKAIGVAVAGAGAAAGALGSKIGSFARAAADKAAESRVVPADSAHAADTGPAVGRMTLREALSVPSEEIEPPLPMLPASTAQGPSQDQSKVVVIIVATFVTLSLLVGYCGTRGMGEGASELRATPRRTVTVNAPPVTVAPSAPPTTADAPAAGKPIAILSATGFDPEGDRTEKNIQAARVYDDNRETSWTSEGYNSTDFGGIGKKGVGVLLDLGQPTAVSRVRIDLGLGPVDVTVYAAIKNSLEGATEIGSVDAANGQVDLKATGDMPPAQYVIVWFTKLAPDDGRFRASISEIALN